MFSSLFKVLLMIDICTLIELYDLDFTEHATNWFNCWWVGQI